MFEVSCSALMLVSYSSGHGWSVQASSIDERWRPTHGLEALSWSPARVEIHAIVLESDIKEDIGIEQQLYEIVRGKNFALNCLSWKFTEMIMVTNEVIPENLVAVR